MKKVNRMKYHTEEEMEIKKFIFVLLGLVIVIVGVYFFTRAFVTKDLSKKTNDIEYKSGTINYDTVIVGNMLSRPEEEYYVLAFHGEGKQATYYSTIASKYMSGKNALKAYYLDIDNELNKKYVAEDDNKSTSFKTIDELKFGELTLLKIKKGKVTKFITTEEEIKKEWNI